MSAIAATPRITRIAARLRPLVRLASEYTTAQLTTRALAAISGLLLVRALPVSEYGYYTLFLAAFGFICTVSDLGVTESLSYFRRRAAGRNRPWTPYIAVIFKFRRTVFIAGFIAGAAYLFHVSLQLGKGPSVAISAVVVAGLSAWFAINSSIVTYALKLQQRFRAAYAVEVCSEACKVLVVCAVWFAGLTSAFAGMASVAIGAMVAAGIGARLLGHSLAESGKTGRRSAHRRKRILLGQVAPVLPGTIHFALQGPLVAWLAAHYASVLSLAEVGALGRLAVIIGLVAGFTSTVFMPRLISVGSESLFRRRYLQWWLVMLVYGAAMMLAVAAFPQALLWLLGGSYRGLEDELMIAAATAVVGTWGAYSWHVNRARGWTRYQPLRVPVMMLGQVVMFVLLDLSTTYGILLFSLWSIALDLCFQTVISLVGLLAASAPTVRARDAR
jgi:O-antigen/teichoic acid export membrane protein